MQVKDGTEQKILEAAIHIFQQKGYAGARLQEIADEAKINKAALHYYFRSKEKLYRKVFKITFNKIFPKIGEAFNREDVFINKIEKFISIYIDFLFDNIQMIHFVLFEIHTNSEVISDILLHENATFNPNIFLTQFQEEIDKGNINPINPRHFFINLISLCVFPFLSRDLFQRVFKMSNEEVLVFLKERKTEVFNFVKASLEVR